MTSSDLNMRLSSLLPPSASRKRRRICPQGNPPPPPLNPFRKLVDDLVVEILIRLPNPRSSSRCKAVCKRWRSLIAEPTFNRRSISHHQSRYPPASLFLLPAHDPQSILRFLPVPDGARPDLTVFDCFKDLLLCGFIHLRGELRRSYFVCNPFTKQWVALPLSPQTILAYYVSAAGLVCQPRSGTDSSSNYSEYRFRVVCLFQRDLCRIMQVFCSESGEWREMHMRNENFTGLPFTNALTWNGKLCWADYDEHTASSVLFGYDPFRPYSPPEPIYEHSRLWGHFSVSQGALHMVTFLTEDSTKSLSVWRQEGDDLRRKYQTVLKMKSTSSWGDYKLEDCFVLDLHPEKPEIVFFEYQASPQCIFFCNLRKGTGEPEFFAAAELCSSDPAWRVLRPRVSCWPTPIPRYEELRGVYDGSYDCWVQNGGTTATLTSTIEYEPLVEQSRRGGNIEGTRRSGRAHKPNPKYRST